jgi:hypothetical protein
LYTDKKEKKIFLIYQEIQNGAVAKSYMTNGLLIYGELLAHFLILGSHSSYMTLQLHCSTLNFLIYEENLIFFFISVPAPAFHNHFHPDLDPDLIHNFDADPDLVFFMRNRILRKIIQIRNNNLQGLYKGEPLCGSI